MDAFDYINYSKKAKKDKQNKKMSKSQKNLMKNFKNESSNILMESSCEDDYFYDSEYDSEADDGELAHKIFGGKGSENKVKIYCAMCAGKHSEENCPNKQYNRS